MKKKILITGGSGFIGSHMVRELVKKNYEVAITTKYDSVYENIRLYNLWKKVKVIECDLRHSNSISKINDFNPKIILHFAAYNDVNGSFLNYMSILITLFSLRNMVKKTQKKSIEKLFNFSIEKNGPIKTALNHKSYDKKHNNENCQSGNSRSRSCRSAFSPAATPRHIQPKSPREEDKASVRPSVHGTRYSNAGCPTPVSITAPSAIASPAAYPVVQTPPSEGQAAAHGEAVARAAVAMAAL